MRVRVRARSTTARREGDFFIVTGEKKYITSGLKAHFFTTAVRTGGPGEHDARTRLPFVATTRLPFTPPRECFDIVAPAVRGFRATLTAPASIAACCGFRAGWR